MQEYTVCAEVFKVTIKVLFFHWHLHWLESGPASSKSFYCYIYSSGKTWTLQLASKTGDEGDFMESMDVC